MKQKTMEEIIGLIENQIKIRNEKILESMKQENTQEAERYVIKAKELELILKLIIG